MLHVQEQTSLEEVRSKVDQAYAAFERYRTFTQAQVDAVVEAMAAAGRAGARRLAEMAVEETGYGNVKDKIVKNLLNADLLCRAIRGMKTVGVLRELPEQKMIEVGVPVGVVAAVLPTTNPTSTVIYKCLIALKAGNGIVISPHPRAARSTCFTASLLHDAAVKAGAPEGIIQCLEQPTMESTHALMKHERVAVILSTGGHGIVKAAYSSGKPAYGVGPGNVPVYLERSADIPDAVAKVVDGKAFDYGTVCSSEQSLVIERTIREAVIGQLRQRKAFLCDEAQQRALANVLLKDNYRINPECVGQSPIRLAELAGFQVPADTSILVVEIGGVGKAHPLSVEKLSPVLALLQVDSHEAALNACEALLRFGGLGHTCTIFSTDEQRIREFGLRMPAMRVLVNTGAPAGSTGITTNLQPSMTLGCGAMAGNITGDNVGPQHLINTKRIAWFVRTADEALPIPPEFREVSKPVTQAEPTPVRIDRQAIAAVIERYLAERGVTAAPARQAPAPPQGVAEAVVDRFLAARGASPASCPAQCPCQGTPASAPPPEPPKIEPPAPKIVIADFVCESDVRAAMNASKKIYIGPKTIVTPSARDLGEQHGILVVAQH